MPFLFAFHAEIGFLLARRFLLFWKDHLRDGSSGEIARSCAGKLPQANSFFCSGYLLNNNKLELEKKKIETYLIVISTKYELHWHDLFNVTVVNIDLVGANQSSSLMHLVA